MLYSDRTLITARVTTTIVQPKIPGDEKCRDSKAIMCGIVGRFYFDGAKALVDAELLIRMRDSMRHRGPDGAGLWISQDRRVGLGHRRLSIIDLSDNASQPMGNHDGSIQIVFNGEIYNHAEIRASLQRLSTVKWKTDHSDTEVILHAFEQWGVDCLQKFRGMFAIAIWDGRKQELWLIRDRLGVKPLYYAVSADCISFASEIKALLVDRAQDRAVDEESLYHYLSFLTSPAPKTLFRGICKLPNSCWLKIDREGRVQEHRYWEVWDNLRSLEGASEGEIADTVLEELRVAVKLRKVSDVPVGVFLSGGIDSSTNAILFSEEEPTQIRTFSIGYDKDYSSYKSEFYYARVISDLVKSSHKERRISVSDLLSFLPSMVNLHDEALGDPVSVPVYYLSLLARESGITVAQCGEGADEIFFGYPHWLRSLRAQRLADSTPGAFQEFALYMLKASGREASIYSEWLRRHRGGKPLFWGGAECFFDIQKRRLLSGRMKTQFKDMTSWDVLAPIWSRFLNQANNRCAINWMGYVDLNLRLPELLLMRLDKMTMAVGLEGREPFLDHKLVELAFSIPPELRVKGGQLKHILKRSVKKLLPPEIVARPKQGFGVPMHEWMLGALGASAITTVREFCKATDYFNTEVANKIMTHGSPDYRWCLLNLALWWKQHIA